MICGNCGKPIGVDEKFCGYCGHPRSKLLQPFEETLTQYAKLKTLYRAGELSEDGYQDAMKKLIFQDAHSLYWMIGSESELWYRFDGKDWVQAEPPHEESPPLRKEPIPPTKPAQAVPVAELEKSKPPSGCRSSCLISLGIVAGLLVLLVGGGLLAWRFFQSEIVNFALNQGWGEIVEPTPISPQYNTLVTLEPAEVMGQSLSPAPSEQAETWILPPLTPIEGWEALEIPEHNLILDWPTNYDHEYYSGNKYLWITDPNPEQAQNLFIYIDEDPYSTQPAEYLQGYMDAVPDYSWSEIQGQEIWVGPMVWSSALLESHIPLFMSASGPLHDGSMLRFEGQAYWGNWDQAMDFWMTVIESIAYTE